MNKNISRYGKIIKQLIDRSFPTLRKENIRIYERENFSYKALVIYLPFFKAIFIDKKLRKASDKALKGLFAHELAHVEIFKKRGQIWTDISAIKYFILKSKKHQKKVEKETNDLVIKKGYKKELTEIRKFKKWY